MLHTAHTKCSHYFTRLNGPFRSAAQFEQSFAVCHGFSQIAASLSPSLFQTDSTSSQPPVGTCQGDSSHVSVSFLVGLPLSLPPSHPPSLPLSLLACMPGEYQCTVVGVRVRVLGFDVRMYAVERDHVGLAELSCFALPQVTFHGQLVS